MGGRAGRFSSPEGMEELEKRTQGASGRSLKMSALPSYPRIAYSELDVSPGSGSFDSHHERVISPACLRGKESGRQRGRLSPALPAHRQQFTHFSSRCDKPGSLIHPCFRLHVYSFRGERLSSPAGRTQEAGGGPVLAGVRESQIRRALVDCHPGGHAGLERRSRLFKSYRPRSLDELTR